MKLPKYDANFLSELLRQFSEELTVQINADTHKICGNDTSVSDIENWDIDRLSDRKYNFQEIEEVSDCVPVRKIKKLEKFLDRLVEDVALLLTEEVIYEGASLQIRETKKKARKEAKAAKKEANLPAYFLQRATYKLGMGDQVIVRVEDNKFECATVVDLPSLHDCRIMVVRRKDGVEAVPFRVDHCDFIGALVKA